MYPKIRRVVSPACAGLNFFMYINIVEDVLYTRAPIKMGNLGLTSSSLIRLGSEKFVIIESAEGRSGGA